MERPDGTDYAAANSSTANSGDPCLQMLLQMLLGDQLEFDYENPWVNEFIDSFIPTTPPFLDPTHIDDGGLTDLSEDTFNGVMLAYTGIGLVDSSIGAVSSYLDASLNESLGFDIRFGPENLGSAADSLTAQPYGELTGTLLDGFQANHLNQDAAFSSIIPRDEGLAVALEGNAFTDVGTPHYDFHQSLEEFWEQYRTGNLSGTRPTSGDYGQALQQALEAAGYSSDEASILGAQAAAQRAASGLTDTDLIPRVPGRINQRQP